MPALYSKLNLWYKKKRNTILSLFLYLKKMNIIFVSILFLLYQFNNSVQSGCITMTTPCVKCSSNVEIVTTTLVEKELKTRKRAIKKASNQNSKRANAQSVAQTSSHTLKSARMLPVD